MLQALFSLVTILSVCDYIVMIDTCIHVHVYTADITCTCKLVFPHMYMYH